MPPQFIDRDDVQRLRDEQDAVIAEVLPRPEYEYAHLAGAIHLPLKGWDADEVRDRLDEDRPVVVYCNSTECDQSPRAAWRLDMLGYDAHDYVAGKQDWLSFHLPHEGTADLVGDHLTTDVPTCRPTDPVGELRQALSEHDGGLVVTTDEGVVLGRLDPDAADADDQATAADVMYEGPTTVRPGEDLETLAPRMQHHDVDAILVTRSDGVLLGLFERETAEQVVDVSDHHVHAEH